MSGTRFEERDAENLMEATRLYNELRADNARLRAALERIAAHEYRADRRHGGMVDCSEVDGIKRTARAALAEGGAA